MNIVGEPYKFLFYFIRSIILQNNLSYIYRVILMISVFNSSSLEVISLFL